MDLMNEIKEIFNDVTKCKNCQYHDECGKYCNRLEELFGIECRTEDESNCIFSENFKLIPDDVEYERTYCKDCESNCDGICMEAYYRNEENCKVSENDYCEERTTYCE